MMSAFVMTVSATRGGGALALAHPVANDLAAAEFDLFAVDREIPLDFDDQSGIGEAHPVAHGRAEHLRIGLPRDLHGHPRVPP